MSDKETRGAKPKMEQPARIRPVMLPDKLVERIDQAKEKMGLQYRSEAIRELLERGMRGLHV